MKTLFFIANIVFVGIEAFLLLSIRQQTKPQPLPLQTPPAAVPALPSPAPAPVEDNADALLVKLIKEKEGFRSRPYRCPAGVLTIGYGFTASKYVRRGKMTEKEASRILIQEIIPEAKQKVQSIVRVPLSSYQMAALTSFVFNCGESNLRRLVNGKNRLNSGNYKNTASALLLYVKANGKTLKGLVERRKMEQKIFLGKV